MLNHNCCFKTRFTRCLQAGLALVLSGLALPALAQFTVSGVADRTVYTDTATFTVVTQAGFSYSALLNGSPVPVGTPVPVTRMDYYDLWATRTDLSAPFDVTNRLVRFIVLASDRGDPERGLIKWTPYPPIPSTAAEFAGAHLHVVTPLDYPAGLPIPVMVRTDDGQDSERRANGFVTAPGFEAQAIQVRRGWGSGFLPPASAPGPINYDAQLHSLRDPKQINIEAGTVWTNVSGTLSDSVVWPENSRIFLNANLTIPANVTVTVGAGTVVKLNPLVNITNTGQMLIAGTPARPVVFTATNVVRPEQPAGAWGGFVMRGSSSLLEANSAIFAGGGGGTGWTNWEGGSSHKSQQPVLYIHSSSAARLTNCCILNSAGQMGNGWNSSLTLDHCLWQRAITGGEYVGGTIIVNHSAIIEFPNDDGVLNATIVDADYDGIYFTTGTHLLLNSLIGFAKDDAIDSGSGGRGTVVVSNCWVESAQHEALAWSGEGRQTWTYDSVLINSGQGIECGWSTTNASSLVSPICYASNLLSTANSVGARYGDNYTGTSGLGNKFGFLTVTNSFILHNYRDVWGQVWDNTWNYRVSQMDLSVNFLTGPNTNHPLNSVWNPPADGPRLASFMTAPPDAPVGIGLALRTNRFALSQITNGVPVRLSSFTTNFVSVDYVVLGSNGPVASGTVEFAPGETVKNTAPVFPTTNDSILQVVLKDPARGEITGLAQAWYLNRAVQTSAPPVTLIAPRSRWNYLDTGGNAGTAWRNLGYNDSGWSNGLAQLGFGDSPSDEATPIRRIGTNGSQTITYYFRQTFVVTNPAALSTLAMWLLRDDGGVVYLNGQDVFRSVNMAPAPTAITYQTLADYNGAGTAENTIDVATFSATNLVAGTNLLAVEIHQHDVGSSDASFDFALTGLVATATSPPIIRQSPTNQTILLGGAASFSVEATGDAPLGYQWWHNATQLVVSTIGPVLALPSVTAADAGTYQVVVLNADGWATSQVATLSVPDADSDGDGLPNGWEQDHGLNPFLNDANLDPDHDGMSNLAEYIAGTDPQNPSSYLKVSLVSTPNTTNGAARLTFEAVAGKSYTVQWAESLSSGSWNVVTNLPAAPSNQVLTVPDPSAAGQPHRYYRLVTPAQ